MAQRADKLRQLLNVATKTADQTQRSFLKAEDVLAGLEDREAQRAAREPAGRGKLSERFPSLRGR